MINLYTDFETDYEKNGAAVLMPTVSTVSEEAGASWELSLTHPMDPRGIWKLLNTGYIIKCPVPVRMIAPMVSGDKLDVYRVTSSAPLRAAPKEPYAVSYPPWYYHPQTVKGYVAGDKVTDLENGHNYQCIQTPVGANIRNRRPSHPMAGAWWKRIPDETGGASTLLTLPAGAEVYLVESVSSSWRRVATFGGAEGYIRASALEYSRTVSADEGSRRTVRDQLFRIYEVDADSAKQLVKVRARHVSYDYNANLLTELVITQQPPAVSLALIKGAMIDAQENIFATNLTAADGLYTQTHSWQNGISALLDPDTGFVPAYKAQLVRDNWDVYIYRNDPVDRGVRLTYGNNLTGVNWKRSSANLINRVIPVAKAADGSDLYLEELFVDSQYIDTYPVIRMERLKVEGQVGKDDGNGGTYTVDSLREHMTAKALERFTVDRVDAPKTELRVSFVLLGDTAEYNQYRQLQQLYLYDTVTVIDPTMGLNESLQVKGYTWDAIRGRYTDIVLGDVFDYSSRAIAGYELKNGSIQINKLSPSAVAELKGV